MPAPASEVRWQRLAVEVFCLFNLGFLTLDVWLAHAANDFAVPAEWLPVYASGAGTLALAIAKLTRRAAVDRVVGTVVGGGAVAVGIAGMLFHLDSGFFERVTLRDLTYTAPFAAPLAFGGVGLLLLLNRMVPARYEAWAWWLWLLALGGWLGTFALSLGDHAQNGFFEPLEWIPVVTAALAVGFLAAPLLAPARRGYLLVCAGLMVLQALVGALGFVLHLVADLERPGEALMNRIIHGAPVFAPLLFADLALLTGIAIWALATRPRADAPAA